MVLRIDSARTAESGLRLAPHQDGPTRDFAQEPARPGRIDAPERELGRKSIKSISITFDCFVDKRSKSRIHRDVEKDTSGQCSLGQGLAPPGCRELRDLPSAGEKPSAAE